MDERPVDLAVLKSFSPLDGLKAENLHALARKTQIRELDAGRMLFKEGDTDKRTFYLVAGSAELHGDGLDVTGDWMTTLLQTKAFHRIPPANIQAIFMRMQRINYRERDVVI